MSTYSSFLSLSLFHSLTHTLTHSLSLSIYIAKIYDRWMGGEREREEREEERERGEEEDDIYIEGGEEIEERQEGMKREV